MKYTHHELWIEAMILLRSYYIGAQDAGISYSRYLVHNGLDCPLCEVLFNNPGLYPEEDHSILGCFGCPWYTITGNSCKRNSETRISSLPSTIQERINEISSWIKMYEEDFSNG